MRTLLTILVLAIAIVGQSLYAQPHYAQHKGLLAWYPLNATPNDSTGHFGKLWLENAPFQPGGGIYCNGIIPPSDPNRSKGATEGFPIYLFKGFTVRVKFKVDEAPVGVQHGYRPILVGGSASQWMAITLHDDSTIGLRYNQHQILRSATRFSMKTWHEATMTYDSASAIGAVYLDGALACSVGFDMMHGEAGDRTFRIDHGSTNNNFKGYIREIQVYVDSASLLSSPEPITAQAQTLALSQNYPNPVTGSTAIDFTLPTAASVSLAVYNSLGQCVATPLNDFLQAGKHSVNWNADGLLPGVYTYRLTAGERTEARMMAIRK